MNVIVHEVDKVADTNTVFVVNTSLLTEESPYKTAIGGALMTTEAEWTVYKKDSTLGLAIQQQFPIEVHGRVTITVEALPE